MAETEKKVVAAEAATEEKKTAAKKPAAKKPAAKKPAAKTAAKKPAAKKAAPKKAAKAQTVTVKLVRSLSGRTEKQIATALSFGLKKVGDVTVQPDNAQTNGKIAKIAHMVAVTKA